MLQQQTKLKHHFPLFDLFLAKTKKLDSKRFDLSPPSANCLQSFLGIPGFFKSA
jgi:hypothetical protein